MNEQLALNYYYIIFVGVIGHAFLGWELGQKGIIVISQEGFRSKKIKLAFAFFFIMVLWQLVRKVQPELNIYTAFMFPLWGVCVFTVSRLTVPRSLRIYKRAKLLHETTHIGNWRFNENSISIESIRSNPRFKKAELLYCRALTIQQRLTDNADNNPLSVHYMKNVAITLIQLSLLYLQQRYLEKANTMASKAQNIIESALQKAGERADLLAIISDINFRYAEIYELQNMPVEAKARYQKSYSIDSMLGKHADAEIAQTRIQELESNGAKRNET